MSIEDTLFSVLSTDGDIAPLVVTATSPVRHRIYPGVAPDNVDKPYLVYNLIISRLPVDLSSVTNLESARFQLDIYATTRSAARVLADHAVDALNSSTMSLSEVNLMYLYENELKLHRYLVDFHVWE